MTFLTTHVGISPKKSVNSRIISHASGIYEINRENPLKWANIQANRSQIISAWTELGYNERDKWENLRFHAISYNANYGTRKKTPKRIMVIWHNDIYKVLPVEGDLPSEICVIIHKISGSDKK